METIDQNKDNSRGNNMLNITLDDKAELYQRYMGFVENGGLFIPTQKSYRIADDIFILLSLPMDGAGAERIPITSRVVWVTPNKAQSNRVPGIGVQFRDNGVARDRIEAYLAGLLTSDRTTYTM